VTPETKRLARLAGAAYVALGAATLVGYYHAPLVHADLEATARAITRSSDLRFRIGVIGDVLSTVLAVPLTLWLYRLFEPVHKTQAALMALLLIVAMPISFVLALNYAAARMLLSGAPELAALAADQREALGMLFLRVHAHGVLAEEIFWGLWLLPLGYLVIKSGFIPRVLGILLFVGGGAYVLHSLVSVFSGGERFVWYERVTMLARGVGELPIMLWLLIVGARVRRADSHAGS